MKNMNFGKERQRKHSVCEGQTSKFVVQSEEFLQQKSSRRKNFQGRQNPRERDFFAPEEVEEWVLPEYRSLFHHLFLKDDEDTEGQSGSGGGISSQDGPITSKNIAAWQARRRKISPSGSTGSSTAPSDDEGPLCNLVKSLPSWLKKVFHISDNNVENQQNSEEIDRHAWLDEIPIEICDKLRHIHIYV